MVRCTSGGRAGQHGGMFQETSREGCHAMQDEAPKTSTATPSPPLGQSSVDKLRAALREGVNKAVADGHTIDQITAFIESEGGGCSRSAVGRYAKNYRAWLREQRESDRAMELWMKEFGDRPPGQSGLVLIEAMRRMVFRTMTALSEGGEPVPMQELERLSVVVKRIEDADKLRLARERAAEEAAEKAAEAAKPEPRKGLSPETEAWIRSQVEGRPFPPKRPVTSVPVDPWNPDESHFIPPDPAESHSIPLDPAEAYPEIAPRVYRHILKD